MSNKSVSQKPLISFDTIQAFFDELEKRQHIRLVKVADQGLVEPAKRGSVLVMQPMVRVVASAFDYKTDEILRWDEKWDVGSNTVSTDASARRNHHDDPTGARTRDRIIKESQKRSLQVVRDEEWTLEDIADTLAGIGAKQP